jgi:hypothetical protein
VGKDLVICIMKKGKQKTRDETDTYRWTMWIDLEVAFLVQWGAKAKEGTLGHV